MSRFSSREHAQAADATLQRSLIERCYGPSPPPQMAVEHALESGFGRLMVLQARLQAQQRRRPARALGFDQQPEYEDLLQRIELLRDTLDELRIRATSGPAAPLAHGFVLASDHQR